MKMPHIPRPEEEDQSLKTSFSEGNSCKRSWEHNWDYLGVLGFLMGLQDEAAKIGSRDEHHKLPSVLRIDWHFLRMCTQDSM